MDKETYDNYLEILKKRLSADRLYHSVEVSKSAVHLAEKYGGDKEKAEKAGLLHDIMKEADRDEVFFYADKYGIEMTELEKSAKKLWHAMVGSAYLENELNIADSDIISSVRYHTTGRGGMTLLEKIIFIADFISADRNYDGVDIMREKAEISLEDAMEEGLSFTIIELIEKGAAVHPDTLDAYNEIAMNHAKKRSK